jgi:hypothetical protein
VTHARPPGLGTFFAKSLLFLTPLIAVSVSYFVLDPFKVLYAYDDYYAENHIETDRDFVSTEIYLRNRAMVGYDSFIFGSSRSLAFRSREWKPYIDAGVPFHFDASAETLYGLWTKLAFLDASGAPIRNALVVVDASTFPILSDSSERGHLYIKDPRVSGRSPLQFQLTFFKDYFKGGFFIMYLDYRLFGVVRPYMRGVVSATASAADPITNDSELEGLAERDADPEKYYHDHEDLFYSRDGREHWNAPRTIGEGQLSMLEDIRRIFLKHQTRYKIIINPLYDQVYFNRQDLASLQSLFGPQNVCDYSGVNSYTSDVRNYVETSHFIPSVARHLLKDCYSD